MADEPQERKSTIHGHSVSTDEDDKNSRHYLQALDTDEAKVIFDQAKTHGEAEFEISKNGTRQNYSAGYKDGKYTVTEQGQE